MGFHPGRTLGMDAMKSIFEDEAWEEVYAARCCDTGERVTLDQAQSFRDSLAVQNKGKGRKLVLRNLRIGANAVSCLALQMRERNYVAIDLSENILGDYGMASVRSLIKAFTSLRSLNISGNLIGAEGIRELADEIEVNTTLESLGLGSPEKSLRPNQIRAEGLSVLVNALRKNETVRSLSLCHNGLTSEAGEPLQALFDGDGEAGTGGEEEGMGVPMHGDNSSHLTSLDLSHNPLTSEGVCAFLPLCTHVRHLDISNTGCRGELIHSPLCELLRKTDSLQSLSLAQNQIEGRAMRKMAFAIGKCATLSSLNLRSTSLSTQGLCAFAEGLFQNARAGAQSRSPPPGEEQTNTSTRLTSLDLSDNPGISSLEAASAVAHIIANSDLRQLKLSRNPLGDAGVREIADALDPQLCPETSLEQLELNSTKLSVPGASHLLACLARNERLRSLKLCDNFLSSEGSGEADLISLLEELMHLEQIQLAGNRLSHAVLHKVTEVCERNRSRAAEYEPARLRGQMHGLLFQETKLEEVKRQIAVDEGEIENHKLNVAEYKEESRRTKRAEEEVQNKLQQEIEKEERLLEMQNDTYDRWETSLGETGRKYEKAKTELREQLEEKQRELKRLVEEAEEVEAELERRKKEHPGLVKSMQEETAAAAAEEEELQAKALEMRKQLKALQEQNKIEF